MSNWYLEIDCVPYDTEISIEKTEVKVMGCMQSLLGRLNNDPEVTGNRYSDECKYSYLIDDAFYFLEFDFEDENVVIKIAGGDTAPTETMLITVVEHWVDCYYDHLNDIGWETLDREKTVINAFDDYKRQVA